MHLLEETERLSGHTANAPSDTRRSVCVHFQNRCNVSNAWNLMLRKQHYANESPLPRIKSRLMHDRSDENTERSVARIAVMTKGGFNPTTSQGVAIRTPRFTSPPQLL